MPAIETTNHPNPRRLIAVILAAFFSTTGLLLLLALCIIAYYTTQREEEEEEEVAQTAPHMNPTPPPTPTEEDEVLFDNLTVLLTELLLCIYLEHRRYFPRRGTNPWTAPANEPTPAPFPGSTPITVKEPDWLSRYSPEDTDTDTDEPGTSQRQGRLPDPQSEPDPLTDLELPEESPFNPRERDYEWNQLEQIDRDILRPYAIEAWELRQADVETHTRIPEQNSTREHMEYFLTIH
ncbi:hypothetical protein ARMGADRAFT_1034140 [Armillaria gallica]|uniref:Uncharacterized protein n=1 Tax=Armillaria gallica TaxID=47427 RepID=A0A2H3DGF4_ARMGA|nr:hypothetical protein ARMGADRAFT_1034140 [Armillaria gallica]